MCNCITLNLTSFWEFFYFSVCYCFHDLKNKVWNNLENWNFLHFTTFNNDTIKTHGKCYFPALVLNFFSHSLSKIKGHERSLRFSEYVTRDCHPKSSRSYLENSPYVNSIFILKHATPAVDMSSNKCNFFISKILGMLLVVSAIKFY